MSIPDHEISPLAVKHNDNANSGLEPIPTPSSSSTVKKIFIILKSIVSILLVLVLAPIALCLLLVLILTGLGPLLEYYLSSLDTKSLNRDQLLSDHPEMFLLEIPSGPSSYQVMVRLTRPPPSVPSIPFPVILPGGLASNLMTMSRHQDALSQAGFIVINFDRRGVGLSDPHSSSLPPTAADVAGEMNHVMTHCNVDGPWIAVGGSMGANVTLAHMTLFPGALCGFLNLDGLPHAFLRIRCRQFLKDGPVLMNAMRWIRWTGIPRVLFSLATRPVLPAMGKVFTPRQFVGVMCRDQFFVATGLEYTTLMSCCDLECAAWGPQATTELDGMGLMMLASLAPGESVLVNEGKGLERSVTNERSKSELRANYIHRQDPEFVEFESKFRSLALDSPTQIDRDKTHCNWPVPPAHPVGSHIGGVENDTPIYPLAPLFQSMVVRVMCARDYTGLERDYTQEARNHAAARCSLYALMGGDCKVYYYPGLSHLNLWQQAEEVVRLTTDIARAISDRK